MIKLGFGLYRHMLTPDYYRFARQCGATHAVIHLVDYYGNCSNSTNQPVGDKYGWGRARRDDEVWELPSLARIRDEMAAEGLALYAIENFNPYDWYDILLDGPHKQEQMARIKQIIRNVGAAGIEVFGYNFSLAGVAGRIEGPFARGGALSVGMDGTPDDPLPDGMVWNMQYADTLGDNSVSPCTPDELWARVEWFLRELLPVAEEAGVRMAAHPDDPPVPTLRGTPRLVYQPALYDKLAGLCDSPSNCFEYCLGTIAEMTEGDLYAYLEKHASQQKLAYIHLRNIRGKVPHYKETFIDEGDLDVKRVMHILHETGYDGVVIPDHAPLMTCDAPWHAGMAFAMGYIKALL